MKLDRKRIICLLEKYVMRETTETEENELFEIVKELEHDNDFQLEMPKIFDEIEPVQLTAEMRERILNNVLTPVLSFPIAIGGKEEGKSWVRRIFSWQRVAVAAAIILMIGTGTYFSFFNAGKNEIAKTVNPNPVQNDVAPGSFKARLTLADGSSIIIDSAGTGQLTKQGNTTVINKDGKLVYESEKESGAVLYNTIATNKGETYSFILADGSKVWLNSASSVHFPVAFPGKERRIEFIGEVYVQVAKKPQQPFIASAKGLEVLALGTEFNINAYEDEENISTTLIEGLVKVSAARPPASGRNQNVILNQGQQTQLNRNGELTAAKNVNTDEIIAWKDGWFHFESADLKTILRQFARWYDVEVVYEGTVKNRKFFGIVKRNSTLRNVLEMLSDNNIYFHIEGKKLVVTSG